MFNSPPILPCNMPVIPLNASAMARNAVVSDSVRMDVVLVLYAALQFRGFV